MSESCISGIDARLVGDPVDTLTGAVVDRILDFRLTGPIELRWYRHYDSSQCDRSFSVGRGCAHEYDRTLSADAEGYLYEAPVGRGFRFPPLRRDGDECKLHGFTIQRVTGALYRIIGHAQPIMEFAFPYGAARARLRRLIDGSSQVQFQYDDAHCLVVIVDSVGRRIVADEDEHGRLIRLAVAATDEQTEYLLIAYRYDASGNLIATRNTSGSGHTFRYDELNRMTLRRGRKGFQFYFKYDQYGRCIRAMGDDRLYGVALEYAVPGRLTRVTKPDLGRWTYKFTEKGQLEEIVDPIEARHRFIRDLEGRLILEVDPNGNTVKYVYDAAGAPVAKIDLFGYRVPLPENPNAPDRRGNRVAANAAEYQYGRLLDISQIVPPDPAMVYASPTLREVRQLFFTGSRPDPTCAIAVKPLSVRWWPEPARGWRFSDFGKLIAQHDDFGRMRRWRYDEFGNEVEHIDFDNGRWLYDYGSWHLLKGITDPSGNTARLCTRRPEKSPHSKTRSAL